MSGGHGWADLPKLVAFSVLDKLFEAIDRIRFGTVCCNWHLMALEYKEYRLVHQKHKKELPMLKIPSTNNHSKRRLYSISEGKIYPMHLSVPNEICIGSCYGWLAFANHKTLVVSLMNPFRKSAPINLPPLEFDGLDYEGSIFKIKKVILSSDPFVSPNNYVVLVIYGGDGKLAFFKPCQNRWGKINLDFSVFTDVVFYKNLFYAVKNFGRIISFNLTSINHHDKPVQVNILTEGSSDVPRV